MNKRIIAFDIALNSTGFTIIDVNTETCECNIVKIGSTNVEKIKERGKKLKMIFEQMEYLKNKYNPDEVVAEKPFSRHAVSTQAIFSAIGVIQLVFSDDEIVWYAPSSVKKSVTGSGQADKETVAEVMMNMFEGVSFNNDDESDSLGVAITHIEQSEEFQVV